MAKMKAMAKTMKKTTPGKKEMKRPENKKPATKSAGLSKMKMMK